MAVQSQPGQLDTVLERVPWSTWVMTAAHDDQRAGVVVHWVQRCAAQPVLVSVSMAKCHSLEPLLRDSRAFALNLVSETDRLLLRKFDGHVPPDELSDTFDSLAIESWASGSPILRRATAAIDCEIVRHIDLESDTELYIGQVLDARVISPG
ncbi:MAG: flavin reductase family protein [Planctomycetota bacterium]